MKSSRRLLLWLWLVALAAGFVGCGGSRSEAVAIRVAALTYAFEQDAEWKAELGKWVFSVGADAETEAVIAALAKFPVSRETLKIEDRGSMARVDASSGKRYAHWMVKVRRDVSSEAMAEVACVKGALNGHGHMLHLKKERGRWIVVSLEWSWIS